MADKVFTITEMKRVASAGGSSAFVAAGVKFEWSAAEHSIPEGEWTTPLQLRTKRVDLPGAEEPVEQVLGWNWAPFTCSGTWDDRYMGEGFAFATLKEFEAMVKRGSIVRVEFERLTLHGLITEFVPAYRREDLIRYTFTCSPHFRQLGESVRGRPAAPVIDPRAAVEAAVTRTQAMEDLQADAGGVLDPNAKAKLKALVPATTDKSVPLSPPFVANDGFLDDVGAGIDAMFGTLGDAMGQIQENVLDPLTEGADNLNRLAQRFAAVKSTTFTMLQQLNSASTTTKLAYETAAATLEFEAWARGLSAQLRLGWLDAHRNEKILKRRANPQAKAQYRPFKGESVYAVSSRYYGTPHEWKRILDANGLGATMVFAGTELLIIPEAT